MGGIAEACTGPPTRNIHFQDITPIGGMSARTFIEVAEAGREPLIRLANFCQPDALPWMVTRRSRDHQRTSGAKLVIISMGRITLRDFESADRAAFVGYQMDPRYRRLYDLDENPARANQLFDLFLGWQSDVPRRNFQLGVFDSVKDRLCGCAGLRQRPDDPETAVLGIELAPADWGRYRIALDATACLVEHGFHNLGIRRIVGDTASGNKRVEKLASWFGARITDQREGPEWMRDRGWHEVDWTIRREEWQRSDKRRQLLVRVRSASEAHGSSL